jgi:hypothetical protein
MRNPNSARRVAQIGKVAAFRERQRLVAERKAEKARPASSASLHTQAVGPGQSPRNPAAPDFASQIARAEGAPRWNGNAGIRWQSVASRPGGPFRNGDCVSHAWFGSGVVLEVNDFRIWVSFHDRTIGERCIHADFLVRQ